MILQRHMPFYREIFAIPDFLQHPILSFGYHGIERDGPSVPSPFMPRLRRFVTSEGKMRRLVNFARSSLRWHSPAPEECKYRSLSELLLSRGHPATTLDFFDNRADLRYDMNQPVPELEHNKYGTLIDIGCLEHLFDTAGCLENCMRMVRRGGYYLLHTPVNGYFGHGLHVFNPQGLIDCFLANGFKIVYLKYTTYKGKPISDPSKSRNVIVWVVGKKEKDVPVFACPQQTIWATDYYPQTTISTSPATAA